MPHNPKWPGGVVLKALPAKSCCMTLDELVIATGYERGHISQLITAMKSQELILAMEPGCYARTLAGDALVTSGKPRRSGPKGGPRSRPRRTNGLSARAWRALRIRRKATVLDLLEIADARGSKGQHIRAYLAALVRHGIVHVPVHRLPHPTLPGIKLKQYVLARDLGRDAPVWRSKIGILFDPNSGKNLPLPEVAQ